MTIKDWSASSSARWIRRGSPKWLTALVAGAVVVLIAVLLSPLFLESRHSGPTPGISNLKRLALATLLYTEDSEGCLPQDMSSGPAVYPAVAPYAKSPRILDTGDPASPNWLGNGSIAGHREAEFAETAAVTIVYFSSAPRNRTDSSSGHRLVSFMDGHIHAVHEPTFQQSIATGWKLFPGANP